MCTPTLIHHIVCMCVGVLAMERLKKGRFSLKIGSNKAIGMAVLVCTRHKYETLVLIHHIVTRIELCG